MGEHVDDLNYDCNYNMFIAKNTLNNLSNMNERTRAIRWMQKLSHCTRTVDEMKLRNDFMYYLVLNLQSGELRPPFTENPPHGPLPALAHLLPTGDEPAPDPGAWAEGSFKAKPMLYQNSPDGGAFLAAQPVPRCGAFCYLAVVSRAKP